MNSEQEKAALAWMRRQAKILDSSISDSESVFWCSRIISARLVPKDSNHITLENALVAVGLFVAGIWLGIYI